MDPFLFSAKSLHEVWWPVSAGGIFCSPRKIPQKIVVTDTIYPLRPFQPTGIYGTHLGYLLEPEPRTCVCVCAHVCMHAVCLGTSLPEHAPVHDSSPQFSSSISSTGWGQLNILSIALIYPEFSRSTFIPMHWGQLCLVLIRTIQEYFTSSKSHITTIWSMVSELPMPHTWMSLHL